MAIDLWSNAENSSLGISPRISFSHDLCQTGMVAIEPRRSDSLLMEESNDFDFSISESFEQDSSSCAGELFSNGKILPLEIKKQQLLPPKPPTYPTSWENSKKESLKEIIEKNYKAEEKPCTSSSSSKSFWRFKRSSSCGNGYTRSLICSLPLLSRSNSTGSAPNPKRSPPLKDKRHSNANTKSSSSSFPYPTSQKSSLKNNYGSYNNGIRISPVLNVPPPYISKGSVNFFGLGSLFCNGKDKNKKKRSEFSSNF